MANPTRNQRDVPGDAPSGDERSLPTRMLDLILRFDAKERRRRKKSDADDPLHQRRRDDKPTASSTHV